MRLTLSFAYPIKTRQPRARNWGEHHNRAEAEVEIKVVDPDVVQLVCEVASTRVRGYGRSAFQIQPTPDGVGRPAKVVDIDGLLYVECCPVDEIALNPSALIPRNPFFTHAKGWQETLLGPVKSTDTRHQKSPEQNMSKDELGAFYCETFAEVADDHGAASRLMLAMRAAELRIVGDAVYAPVSEPRLLVKVVNPDVQKREDPIKVVVKVVESEPEHLEFGWRYGDGGRRALFGHDGSATFAIDRKESALAFASILIQSDVVSKDDVPPELEDSAVIGLINNEFLRDDGADEVGRAADGIVAMNDIMPLSEDTLVAWAELRDISNTIRFGGVRVAEALRRFAQAAEMAGDNIPVEIARARAGFEEYDHARAMGRGWAAVGQVSDSYTNRMSAWQAGGWTDIPRKFIAELAETFQPGVDRLVRVRPSTMTGDRVANVSVPFAEAAFIFGGLGDNDEPIASAIWGDSSMKAEMLALAKTHERASRDHETAFAAEADIFDGFTLDSDLMEPRP